MPILGFSSERLDAWNTKRQKIRKQKCVDRLFKNMLAAVAEGDAAEAFRITKSKLYENFYYKMPIPEYFTDENDVTFYDLVLEHKLELARLEKEEDLRKYREKEVWDTKWEGFKENAVVTKVGMILAITLSGTVYAASITAIGKMLWYIGLHMVIPYIGSSMKTLGFVGLSCVAAYSLYTYIFIPLSCWVTSLNFGPVGRAAYLPLKWLIIKPLLLIGKGLVLTVDMVNNWYTQNCPMITWEDENSGGTSDN